MKFKLHPRQVVLAVCAAVALLALVLIALGEPGYRIRVSTSITRDSGNVDMVAMNEMTSIIGLLREGYVYRSRLRPRAMLLGALRAAQDKHPSMLVTEEPLGELEDIEAVTVSFAEISRRFTLEGVNDLYAMNWKLMEIGGFLAPELVRKEDSQALESLEEQLLEGMLSTLDPHTVYLDERALENMKLSTTGRFGGLGVVISVRQGRLLVMSVMENTPADEAGLKTGDHVVQIEEESTENMTVSEAAGLLRGEAGSTVSLWISRKGWSGPRRMLIERRIIQVKSLEAEMLPRGVAYLKVKNFQRETAKEVETFLEEHKRSVSRGIILDLRDNSGGLLQEAVELGDLFLDSGTIVSTRSRNQEDQEVDSASPGDPWERTPLVVLVNRNTASASEIVAGALKLSGRATVVGTRTFGKGSVQFLRELDKGAFKMTVAQYLNPDDVSIQGSGIQPHIEMLPIFADRQGTYLSQPPVELTGEEDLDHSLTAEVDKPDPFPPVYQYFYLVDSEDPGDDSDEEGDEAPGDFEEESRDALDEDLEMALLLLKVADGKPLAGQALVELACPYLARREAGSMDVLGLTLLPQGVLWSPRGAEVSPEATSVEASLELPAGDLVPGEETRIKVHVRNKGARTLDQLHGVLLSSNPAFSEQDCMLGTLEPGQTGTCELILNPAAWSPDRTDLVWVDLYAWDVPILSVGPGVLGTRARARPRAGLAYRFDEVGISGNNMVEAGEEFELLVTVWNLGEGELVKGSVTIKPAEEGHFYMIKGREKVEHLLPGESRQVRFKVRARQSSKAGEKVDMKLWVTDTELRNSYSWTIPIPVFERGHSRFEPMEGVARVKGEGRVPVYSAPSRDLPRLGWTRSGPVLALVGRSGNWRKVRFGDRLEGWLPEENLLPMTRGLPELPRLETAPQLFEPRISITSLNPDKGLGTSSTLKVEGEVDFGETMAAPVDGEVLVSAYVNGDKRSVKALTRTGTREQGRFSFELDLPLASGPNRIVISTIQPHHSQAYLELIYNRVTDQDRR